MPPERLPTDKVAARSRPRGFREGGRAELLGDGERIGRMLLRLALAAACRPPTCVLFCVLAVEWGYLASRLHLTRVSSGFSDYVHDFNPRSSLTLLSPASDVSIPWRV